MGTPRKTTHLAHRAAANLSRAVSHAAAIGKPLNQFVSINYGLTGCNEEDMVAAFRRLLKSFFVKWHTRHPRVSASADPAAAYVWTAEGLPGRHGVHWLVHVPPALVPEFKSALWRWLERTAGPIIDKDALDVRPAWSAGQAKDYMLKGLPERHARRFKIKWASQGVVYGKRCGISENLGPKAIARRKAEEKDDAATA